MEWSGNLSRILVSFLFLGVTMSSAAFAQGGESSSTPSQSRGEAKVREGEARQQGQAAHVGAGTTESSTTGHSGPTPKPVGAPGEISLPPLPDPSLCDSYMETPAHQGCLQIVLREEKRPR